MIWQFIGNPVRVPLGGGQESRGRYNATNENPISSDRQGTLVNAGGAAQRRADNTWLTKSSTVVYNERMMSSAVAQKIVKRHTVHNRESVAKREHQALLISVGSMTSMAILHLEITIGCLSKQNNALILLCLTLLLTTSYR